MAHNIKPLNLHREIYSMELQQGQKLANQIVEHISPFCDRIRVAGSIRRRKPQVRDVDIVLIPKSWVENLEKSKGKKMIKDELREPI